MTDSKQQPAPSIRNLLPTLSEDEARLADERIDCYLALAAEVFQDLRADPDRYAAFQRRLTELQESSTLTREEGRTDNRL